MTITINLSEEAERVLAAKARLHDMTLSNYLTDLAHNDAVDTQQAHLSQKERTLAAMERWKHISSEESAEYEKAWEILRKSLDEDRLSPSRPLFPEGCEL